MNVNLDSFRAMAEGKYNLGSVVVTTDAETSEQRLIKVDNHKHRTSLNVKPTREENIKTRQVLSSLMKAHLQKLAGADIERDPSLNAEFKQIDDILLGKDLEKPLRRSGTLAGAFWAFDNFEARLLETRAVTNRLRVANAAMVKTEEAKEEQPSESNAPATTKTLMYYDGTSTEPAIVIEKASEATIAEFNSLLEENRDREAVTKKQEQLWAAHPEDRPKATRPRKAVDTARKLRKEDMKIVDLLTRRLTANELGHELAQNPSVAHAMQRELFGALKFLAKVKTTHDENQQGLPENEKQPLPAKTISVKVYVDNAKITTTTMDLTLKSNGKLELALRGHRFELAYSAEEIGRLINESSTVKARTDTYFSNFDEVNHTRNYANSQEYFCAWNGNVKSVDKADSSMVRMFPPDDLHGAESKIAEILDKLREVNNKDPLRWGGSPHYGNAMPQLEPLRHSRFGNRTWAHIRSYCNKQIEKGGIHALFGRTLAKIQGVPLEAGQSCGISDTKFEKAALFLNKVRILALNANWIMSQFENKEGESDNDAINRVCTTVSDICQLQLHPSENLTMHTKQFLQSEIRTLIQSTLAGYDVAVEKNNLADYFTALADGVCFQGCVTYVTEFLDNNGMTGLTHPPSVYPADVQEQVKQGLESKLTELRGQIADLDGQILTLEGELLALEGEAKTSQGPQLMQQKGDLERQKAELVKNLKFWESREIGTGALMMKNGEVVLEKLPAKEVESKSGVKTQVGNLNLSSTSFFIGEVLSPLLHDIYHEIRFGDKKGLEIGKPPFYLPKVDMMVDLIVERFVPMVRAAAQKGEVVRKPELEKELAKLETQRVNIKAALEMLTKQDGQNSVKFLELLKQHGEFVNLWGAKTQELKNSAEYKARTVEIKAATDQVKGSDEYKAVTQKIEEKTREIEASEVYKKLTSECEEQIKVIEGSKRYVDLSRALEAEKKKIPGGDDAYKNLQTREKELLDEKGRVIAWYNEWSAATKKGDKTKIAELETRPEAALFEGWKNGKPQSLALAGVQNDMARFRQNHAKFFELQEQQAQLKKPILDETDAKQTQLKNQVMKGLIETRDRLFSDVKRLKEADKLANDQFLADSKAKLDQVEESLKLFRKAMPVYDENVAGRDERSIIKKMKKMSSGISAVLQRTGQKAVQARTALLGRDADSSMELVKAELNKLLECVEAKIESTNSRIGKVGSLELNMAMVQDNDLYGDQKEDFIYLSVEDLEPGHEANLDAFKVKIRDELVNGRYCYTKKPGEKRYVIGEETLLIKQVKGKGFYRSVWNTMLHGSEFFKGVTEDGRDVYRSNEGLEAVSPQISHDITRRSSEREDYLYEDGDMMLEFMIGG